MGVTKEFQRYIWTDEQTGISVTMRHIDKARGGSYNRTAHVTVEAETPYGQRVEIIKGRIGVSGVSERDTIAEKIERTIRGNDRTNDEGMRSIFGLNSPVFLNDWKYTLKEACEDILDLHYRGGEPVNLFTKLGDDDEVWRVTGMLSEDINVMYGNSGSGKSYMGIIWGAAIQHGLDFCGLPTNQGNVLLMDYETTENKMRRRFRRVHSGLGIVDDDPILYMTANIPLAYNVEQMQEYILKHNIQFLIIDSLGRAVGGKVTEDDTVNQFFEALHSLEVASLIIHHTNKGDDYYGSTYIRANARNLWRIRSVHSEDSIGTGGLSIMMEQEKENDGPSGQNVGLLMRFNGDPLDAESVTVELQDPTTEDALLRHVGVAQMIEARLKDTEWHRMRIRDSYGSTKLSDDIPNSLGFDKDKRDTLEDYIFTLENDLKKHRYVRNTFYIQHTEDGSWLCLLKTAKGQMSWAEINEQIQGSNGVGRDELISMLEEAKMNDYEF
jgi:hypothetical protein